MNTHTVLSPTPILHTTVTQEDGSPLTFIKAPENSHSSSQLNMLNPDITAAQVEAALTLLAQQKALNKPTPTPKVSATSASATNSPISCHHPSTDRHKKHSSANQPNLRDAAVAREMKLS